MEEKANSFLRLVELMAQLRSEEGCPWDREQTKENLKTYLLEETYEVLEAIDADSHDKLKEELGDLLFQVIFLARLCEEEGGFDIFSVIETICQKMIRRHPHVFGQTKLETSREVLKNWERIKQMERAHSPSPYLSDVPKSLPSLLRALRITEKASRVGFDWKSWKQVYEKVKEEMEELEQALNDQDLKHKQEEMGDLLFSLANLSRFIAVDPEEALRKTVAKFISRFSYIEERLKEKGKSLGEATLEEMDQLWDEFKRTE